MRALSVLLCAGAAQAFLAPRLVQRPQLKMMSSTTTPTGAKDIVDVALAAGSFTTLAKALTAAGLIDTLKGPGPFTVFAPTDEAFAKVPQATLEALLADPAKLASVLTYHVVPGTVPASEVAKLSSAKTVQGSSVRLSAAGGKVTVDNANVIAADVAASNGVIHVIDSVILPPAAAPKPAAAKAAVESPAARIATLELTKAGSSAPFGYFDPLGLSKGRSVKELKRWRESEVKHGRIAMLAVVGVLIQERFAPFYQGDEELALGDPGAAFMHFQKLEAVNPVVLFFLVLGIGVVEAFTIGKGWDAPDDVPQGKLAGLKDNYIAGDLEFDPLQLAPTWNEDKFFEFRTKELNNGRLAMLAWAGMMAQELVNGQKIFG